jgi:hypothetical protein
MRAKTFEAGQNMMLSIEIVRFSKDGTAPCFRLSMSCAMRLAKSMMLITMRSILQNTGLKRAKGYSKSRTL